jgi:hypothetical protein
VVRSSVFTVQDQSQQANRTGLLLARVSPYLAMRPGFMKIELGRARGRTSG